MITHSILKELIHYDPDTGVFTWLQRARKWFKSERDFKIWNTRYAGEIAGTISNTYFKISIFKQHYMAHRLAWFYVHGKWPNDMVLHDDQNSMNNKINNLSDNTQSENAKNKVILSNNTSGFTGVNWHKTKSKWRAFIKVNKKSIHLGYFVEKEKAIAARKAADIQYGFHELHGGVNFYDINHEYYIKETQKLVNLLVE